MVSVVNQRLGRAQSPVVCQSPCSVFEWHLTSPDVKVIKGRRGGPDRELVICHKSFTSVMPRFGIRADSHSILQLVDDMVVVPA